MCAGSLLTFAVQRVIDNEFAIQNLVIAQTQRAEAMCDPAQSFTGGMRIRGLRVRRSYDVRKQAQSGVAQFVFPENGVERDTFTVVAEIAPVHIEHDGIRDAGPVGVGRQKLERCIRINKMPDEPRAGDSINLHVLSCDPFHSASTKAGA